MYEQSHRDYLRSGYLHHRLPVMVCNHYRDNAITYKAQRDKNARELKLANAAITDMQMRCVMLLRSMQNTRRSQLMLKLKMMLCVTCCRWSSSVAHREAVCQSCEATTASGDNAASPDWQTPLNGIISPSES